MWNIRARWVTLTRSRLNFQRSEVRLQRVRPSRGCAATEDRPASLRHHLAVGLHTIRRYAHAAVCDITVSIDHYRHPGWMIMIANVSLRHHHAFLRHYVIVAAVGGQASFAPTTAGWFDRMIHAYGNGVVGQVFGTDFYCGVFTNDRWLGWIVYRHMLDRWGRPDLVWVVQRGNVSVRHGV